MYNSERCKVCAVRTWIGHENCELCFDMALDRLDLCVDFGPVFLYEERNE